MFKHPIFASSAATGNSGVYGGQGDVASVIVLEVVDEGSWSGSIKVAARAAGRGKAIDDAGGDSAADDFDKFISITNRNDETTIDGDTGITAAGIYEINVAGLEVQFQHTRAAGAVSVYGTQPIG